MALLKSGLKTIYSTLLRAQESIKNPPKSLKDIFTESPRLIITPSNQCDKSCLHCVASSSPQGEIMPYSSFSKISPDFFKIFKVADFGRRGNPLLYSSEGKDLVDMLDFLKLQGINYFTLALALQPDYNREISRLEDFSKSAEIETMITYHHYFEPLNPLKLAEDFNLTLKNYSRFSRKILISLLGDRFSQENPTKAEEVQKTFQDNWEIIFKDFCLTKQEKTYEANYKGKEIQIKIPSVDTRVYPLGRFRSYLEKKGILKEYEEKFSASMSDYACPDLIKWPGIIIEPDGSLNLCASFEAICCRNAISSNIFSSSYQEVEKELMSLHQREFDWFVKNIKGIISGNVSMCRIENNLYRS